MPGEDLYLVLGVPPQASGPEIRAAYEKLTQQLSSGEVPAEQRPGIEEAYQTLGDPIRRLRYDAQAAAPPPPRFQMPSVSLPGRRFTLPVPHLRRIHIPGVRRVDPLIASAIGLVAIVALLLLLLPLIRGRSAPSAPPQSVADLVPSPTATRVATAPPGLSTPRAATPASVLGLGLPSAPTIGSGGGLLPLPGAPPNALTQTSEPPFLTASAVVDMLRAVIAAAAVRNGPAQASIGQPPLGAVTAAPAGFPITSLSNLPPVVSGAAPSGLNSPVQPVPGEAGATFPSSFLPPGSAFGGLPNSVSAPTPTPAPNHISVPTAPIRAGAAPVAGIVSRGGAAPASAPNRIGGPPTPTPTR